MSSCNTCNPLTEYSLLICVGGWVDVVHHRKRFVSNHCKAEFDDFAACLKRNGNEPAACYAELDAYRAAIHVALAKE